MLPKPHRLTEKKDFKRVITYGHSFFVKECGIKILRTKYPTRIGIIVPKKITKTIVKRNRIKRQVRHIFLRHLHELSQGYDIIFFARIDFLNLTFKEMEGKVVKIMKLLHC